MANGFRCFHSCWPLPGVYSVATESLAGTLRPGGSAGEKRIQVAVQHRLHLHPCLATDHQRPIFWTFRCCGPSTPPGGPRRCARPTLIAAADIASTSRTGFARHSPRQDQLSYQIIFFLHLLAEAVQFGFLIWTNYKVSFYWPATVGTKICGIRELKTTIQTISGHICPPYLSSAIVSGGIVGWGTSHEPSNSRLAWAVSLSLRV